MALTVGDRPVRRFTVNEALAMHDAGIIDGRRVELLHGALVEKPVTNPPHIGVVARLHRWLAPGYTERRYDLHIQTDYAVPDRYSLPQPDLSVVEVDDSVTEHPHDARLLIEVSDTTLRFDSTVKQPLYSGAAVPEYWIVDVNAKRVLVFTDPAPDGYGTHRTVAPPGTLQPERVEVEPLDLDALFAGL